MAVQLPSGVRTTRCRSGHGVHIIVMYLNSQAFVAVRAALSWDFVIPDLGRCLAIGAVYAAHLSFPPSAEAILQTSLDWPSMHGGTAAAHRAAALSHQRFPTRTARGNG
jgi:hypothetical protein